MNLSADQVRAALYAVRDLIARRTVGNQPIPREVHQLHKQLSASVTGSECCAVEPELTTKALIDTTEAAEILHCTTRRVRQITADLDGVTIGHRWLFDRQTVIDYAELKGQAL